jgi:hypothetical protein
MPSRTDPRPYRRSDPSGLRLDRVVQVRFTDQQYGWLSQIAQATQRPLSAIARDVITVWAINWHRKEDPTSIDLEGAIAELDALGDAA